MIWIDEIDPGTVTKLVLAYGEEALAVLSRGAWWVSCPECDGTGVFVLPDYDTVPCNYCKTGGLAPVALEGEL